MYQLLLGKIKDGIFSYFYFGSNLDIRRAFKIKYFFKLNL